MSRGGKRDGAGRKTVPATAKKVQLTVTVKPETRAWLKEHGVPPGQILDNVAEQKR